MVDFILEYSIYYIVVGAIFEIAYISTSKKRRWGENKR